MNYLRIKSKSPSRAGGIFCIQNKTVTEKYSVTNRILPAMEKNYDFIINYYTILSTHEWKN
jgi:hypothetical protein